MPRPFVSSHIIRIAGSSKEFLLQRNPALMISDYNSNRICLDKIQGILNHNLLIRREVILFSVFGFRFSVKNMLNIYVLWLWLVVFEREKGITGGKKVINCCRWGVAEISTGPGAG